MDVPDLTWDCSLLAATKRSGGGYRATDGRIWHEVSASEP